MTMTLKRVRAFLGPLVSLALFCIALWAIHREFAGHQLKEIAGEFKNIPAARIVTAALFAAGSYLALVGYDALALRHVKHSLTYFRIALASFVGNALSNNLGFMLVTGAPVRLRLYAGWGLTGAEVAEVVGFNLVTFWMGFLFLGGAALLFGSLPPIFILPEAGLRLAGFLFLAVVAGYVALSIRQRGRTARIRSIEFSLPAPSILPLQLAVAAADWLCVSSVLYTLLPEGATGPYLHFLALFLIAQLLAVASQVPGGLGVFEGTLLVLLRDELTGQVLAALVAYRMIYYIVPLGSAALLIAGYETARRRRTLGAIGRAFSRWIAPVAPQVFALAAFVSGAVLLVSSAAPAVAERLAWLKWVVPLPLLEISHLLGSLFGVCLLFIAGGLYRRLDGAWLLGVVLLGGGVAVSLLKGLDYEEAALLGLILLALLPCRGFFRRKSSLMNQPFSPEWTAAVILVLVGTGWILFLAGRHVEYANDLWWEFAFESHVPRALRATTGAAVLAAVFGLFRLLHGRGRLPEFPGEEELRRAEAVVRAQTDSSANLVFLGDKRILFNEAGTTFVMFSVKGNTWASMGGPVGPETDRAELAWSFRDLCDVHGARCAFYEVCGDELPVYVDMGLSLVKLGEEARVPLADFDLSGAHRKSLRSSVNRIEKLGCTFDVVPPEGVDAVLGELREISDEWLASKRTREKGFSLGFFSPSYVRRFPVAVLRAEGRIAAFANLWLGGNKEELSPDLMRYRDDAPHGSMDYLFVELMLWGKEQGYRWFNLGMAPLSGLEDRSLAPFWNRAGAAVFRHGENFYNFQGLREYKEKFDPVWRPRYLASPGGLALPAVLLDLAALTSGGWKGVIGK